MRTTLRILAGLGAWFATGLSIGPAFAAEVQTQLLVYRVFEPGGQSYVSRILVTPTHLRLDQGEDDAGFILFDRVGRIVYSINPDDRTILRIKPEERERGLPAALQLQIELVEEQGMPAVSGNKPEYWRLLVNGKSCRSAVVAPGLMPKATRAYSEYLDLLAYQHLDSLAGIPEEMRDPCDLAVNIYAPLAIWRKGLPLREWSEQDWGQELIDYREAFPVDETGFRLPEDYRTISLGGS
jgi:hypothetical protein